MPSVEKLLDRLVDDPEAIRLLGEVVRAKATHDEAVRQFRAHMLGEKEPVTEPPEQRLQSLANYVRQAKLIAKDKSRPTIGERAYQLIVEANGNICTSAELAEALGLTATQVSQGLKDFLRKGLVRKPVLGAYQWTGGSNGNDDHGNPKQVAPPSADNTRDNAPTIENGAPRPHLTNGAPVPEAFRRR